MSELRESIQEIVPGIPEKILATLIFLSILVAGLISWTAFFGGHIPFSIVHFTEANPWRGVAFSLFIAPLLVVLGTLLSMGIVTILMFCSMALPQSMTDRFLGSLPSKTAISPIPKSKLRRF